MHAKTMTLIAVAGATAAFAAPAGAAKPTAKVPSAQSQCRQERTSMGKDLFAAAYGTNASKSNAFGKCVSHRNADTRAARKAAKGDTAKVVKTVKTQMKTDVNAAKSCQAERTADPSGFADKYGTGSGKHNAFGKCVSMTARAKHTTTN